MLTSKCAYPCNLRIYLLPEQKLPQRILLNVPMVYYVYQPHVLPALPQQPRSRRLGRVHTLPLAPYAERLFQPCAERLLLNYGWSDDPVNCLVIVPEEHPAGGIVNNIETEKRGAAYSLPAKEPHVTGFTESSSEASKSPSALPAKYVTPSSRSRRSWSFRHEAEGQKNSTNGYHTVVSTRIYGVAGLVWLRLHANMPRMKRLTR